MGVVPRGAHRLIEGRGAGARRVWRERAKSVCATGGHASLPWGESSTPPPPVCPGSPPHSCLLAPSAAPCLFGGGCGVCGYGCGICGCGHRFRGWQWRAPPACFAAAAGPPILSCGKRPPPDWRRRAPPPSFMIAVAPIFVVGGGCPSLLFQLRLPPASRVAAAAPLLPGRGGRMPHRWRRQQEPLSCDGFTRPAQSPS